MGLFTCAGYGSIWNNSSGAGLDKAASRIRQALAIDRGTLMKAEPGQFRRTKGLTLVEVMLAVFVLALTAIILIACFPTSQISRIKAAHLSYAVGLAQKQMEEFRSAGYASVLVSDPVNTPVAELPSGSQTITITQYAPNVKQIEVTITWEGYRKVGGSTTLVTLISDHG